MREVLFPLLTLLAVAGAFAVDWLYFVPRLPAQIVVHIGPGEEKRWMDRDEFLRGSALWLVITPLGLLAVAAFSAAAVRYFPASNVNLPRKDYWMVTSERRTKAAAILFGFFLWVLVALLSIALVVFHTLFVVSLNPAADSTPLLVGVLVGTLFVLLQVGVLMWRFSRPPSESPAVEE